MHFGGNEYDFVTDRLAIGNVASRATPGFVAAQPAGVVQLNWHFETRVGQQQRRTRIHREGPS